MRCATVTGPYALRVGVSAYHVDLGLDDKPDASCQKAIAKALCTVSGTREARLEARGGYWVVTTEQWVDADRVRRQLTTVAQAVQQMVSGQA